MSNAATKKIFIQIETAEEQQEHLRNQRKTLKVLQSVATDKENFAGRQQIDTLSRLKAAADLSLSTVDHGKRKKIETRSIETQTSPKKHDVISAAELTSTEKPGENYFERLAEKRREALEAALTENRSLHERIEGLEEELNTTRKILEESRSLVEVLTEMINENEGMEEEQRVEDCIKDDDSDTRSSVEASTDDKVSKNIEDSK